MARHSREFRSDNVEYVLIAHRHQGGAKVLAVYANLEDARIAAIDQMHPFVSIPTGEWQELTTATGYARITIHKAEHFPSQAAAAPSQAAE